MENEKQGFKSAVKSNVRLKMGIVGPSGSGKTMSALRIASGLGKKIALIDTERGSASLYADRFKFDVLELKEFSIPSYIDAMILAYHGKYDVLIIDSLSHAWEWLLEYVDQQAAASTSKNSFTAWNKGTPLQKDFVNKILNIPIHVIGTMRSKTEWALDKDEKGKTIPRKIGLAPEQRKGMEYEFSLLMEINSDHYATVTKDRTGKFQDKIINCPNEALGKELYDWLNSAEPQKQEIKNA